jgi:hypothetical protein
MHPFKQGDKVKLVRTESSAGDTRHAIDCGYLELGKTYVVGRVLCDCVQVQLLLPGTPPHAWWVGVDALAPEIPRPKRNLPEWF